MPLRTVILLALLALGSLQGASERFNFITAGEYCDFLNAIAETDFHHPYDENQAGGWRLEARGPEITTATLLRFGEPGTYHYEVAQGKEDAAITFVSQDSAKDYFHWLEDASSSCCSSSLQSPVSSLSFASTDNFNSCQGAFSDLAAPDPFLKSNRDDFQDVNFSPLVGFSKKNGKGAKGLEVSQPSFLRGILGFAFALAGGGERVAPEKLVEAATEDTAPVTRQVSSEDHIIINPDEVEEIEETVRYPSPGRVIAAPRQGNWFSPRNATIYMERPAEDVFEPPVQAHPLSSQEEEFRKKMEQAHEVMQMASRSLQGESNMQICHHWNNVISISRSEQRWWNAGMNALARNDHEGVSDCREVAEKYQEALEESIGAAKAVTAERENEREYCGTLASSIKSTADRLAQGAEAFKKTQETRLQGKYEASYYWLKSARTARMAAEHYIQSAQVYRAGKEEFFKKWKEAAEKREEEVYWWDFTAQYQESATTEDQKKRIPDFIKSAQEAHEATQKIIAEAIALHQKIIAEAIALQKTKEKQETLAAAINSKKEGASWRCDRPQKKVEKIKKHEV